jgi:hypothetical protein
MLSRLWRSELRWVHVAVAEFLFDEGEIGADEGVVKHCGYFTEGGRATF